SIPLPLAAGTSLLVGGIFFVWWIRRKQCGECGGRLTRLSASATQLALSPVQKIEARVGGAKYDAWKCLRCGQIALVDQLRATSRACPKCSAHALTVDTNIQQPATA